MGVMIEGRYHAADPAPDTARDGSYQRQKATIRHQINADGPHLPEPGRYHLFVAWNCPWAHRVILTTVIKGLTGIGFSYALPRRTDQGWVFDDAGDFADPLFGARALHEIYSRHPDPFTGRITVPVLWDKQLHRAVSNESAEIMRMLNDAFADPDLAPAALRTGIDAWNARIYPAVNNGVYKAGFARTQAAYDAAVITLFDTLDALDAHLATNRYLMGDRLTEADLRLFPTLARFDVAYHYAFKCNIRRLMDYRHLWPYAREIYQMPGVAATVKPEIYKAGYFSRSELRNPLGIIPAGPRIDWTLPHGRG